MDKLIFWRLFLVAFGIVVGFLETIFAWQRIRKVKLAWTNFCIAKRLQCNPGKNLKEPVIDGLYRGFKMRLESHAWMAGSSRFIKTVRSTWLRAEITNPNSEKFIITGFNYPHNPEHFIDVCDDEKNPKFFYKGEADTLDRIKSNVDLTGRLFLEPYLYIQVEEKKITVNLENLPESEDALEKLFDLTVDIAALVEKPV